MNIIYMIYKIVIHLVTQLHGLLFGDVLES